MTRELIRGWSLILLCWTLSLSALAQDATKDAEVEHLLIPLFYHDNPKAIIDSIVGEGSSELITGAEVTALTTARGVLSEAQSDLASARGQLEAVQSTIRRVNASLAPDLDELAKARGAQRVAASTRYDAELKKGVHENKLQAAEKRLELDPKNEQLAQEKRQAQKSLVDAEEKFLTADSAYKKSEARVAKITERVNAHGDVTGKSVEQLTQLRTEEDKLQKTLADAHKKYISSAIAEAIAFGQVRKSETVHVFKKGGPTEVPRIICAFSDARQIYLSGPRSWVHDIATRVDLFDRPEPQAVLTLWSLEMSSHATDDGADSVTEALALIDKELATARQGVRAEIDGIQQRIVARVTSNDGMLGPTEAFHKHIAFYPPQVLNLMVGRGGEAVKLTDEEMRRLEEFVVPDPAEVSSLAHALVVYAMLNSTSQSVVKRQAETQRPSLFLDETLRRLSAPQTSEKTGSNVDGEGPNFPSTLTPFSRELALAFRARGEARVVSDYKAAYSAYRGSLRDHEGATKSVRETGEKLERTQAYLGELEKKIKKAGKDKKKLKVLKAEQKLHKKQESELNTALQASSRRAVAAKARIRNSRTKSASLLKMLRYLSVVEVNFSNDPNDDKSFEEFKEFTRKNQAGLKFGAEAVINEKLKVLLGNANEDLQRIYIEPMYSSIRKKLRNKGLQVGILQRTSILASNRRLSQVDPRASASLEVTKRQDILKAALQLGEILSTAETGGLLLALQNQNLQEKAAPPEVYGLTTGNRFQVRPFVDPTGQALSFDFDFVGASTIRDPDDSSNPQLNRIEKHTINTKVQLSNMEVREVSRFLVNAKVGVPEKRHGGLPILNDIPIIQDIPLIGWFSRTYGRAPVVQQSLVLGQTSVIPTIEILSDLMVHHKRAPLRL